MICLNKILQWVLDVTGISSYGTKKHRLKGGNKTLDVRLDRVVQFDERSRNYPVRTVISQIPKTKTWACNRWNDQGQEGACVGFSWSHELSADPVVIAADSAVATRIYKLAQTLDQWPGEAYEGTSVLAGAKAVQTLKSRGVPLMPEYRWAFGIDDLILAVGNLGPAVLGVNWYQGMTRTNSQGFIVPSGGLVGGHAILCRGITLYWVNPRTAKTLDNIDRQKSYFTLRNSWGRSWGKNGDCYITVADMDTLLKQDGEAVIPVRRK